MNCICKKFEGSTTIMCCNKCKLPLKNEPWSINLLAEITEKRIEEECLKYGESLATNNYVDRTYRIMHYENGMRNILNMFSK